MENVNIALLIPWVVTVISWINGNNLCIYIYGDIPIMQLGETIFSTGFG